jgi:Ca-activated chloride channel family protein
MASEISPAIMPEPGDRLDLALREASRILTDGRQGGSIVVLADSVDTDPAALQTVARGYAFPVQLLAINAPDSSQDASMRSAARTLHATVQALSVKEEDVAAIVRRAAHAPRAEHGQQGEHWQEAGYWLVPPVGLILLASFRRKEIGPARSKPLTGLQ